MFPVNRKGESLPLMVPDYSNLQYIDGSVAHAEGSKMAEGIYRVAVVSSTDNAGVHLKISVAGTSATVANGVFMPHNSFEYFAIEEGMIISALGGKINVVKYI